MTCNFGKYKFSKPIFKHKHVDTIKLVIIKFIANLLEILLILINTVKNANKGKISAIIINI
jgi:hypothetical protein